MSADSTKCPLGSKITHGCEMLLYYLLESPLCIWPKQNLIHSEEKNQLIKMCPGVIISSDINMVIMTLFHMFKKLSKEIEDIKK